MLPFISEHDKESRTHKCYRLGWAEDYTVRRRIKCVTYCSEIDFTAIKVPSRAENDVVTSTRLGDCCMNYRDIGPYSQALRSVHRKRCVTKKQRFFATAYVAFSRFSSLRSQSVTKNYEPIGLLYIQWCWVALRYWCERVSSQYGIRCALVESTKLYNTAEQWVRQRIKHILG